MIKIPFVISLISLFLISCSSEPIVREQVSEEPKVEKAQQPKKEMWGWDYSSQSPRGPEQWASLNPQYYMCATGQNQSPVNLVWTRPTGSNPLTINYKDGNATIMNAGHTMRIEMTPQSSIILNGMDYMLEKIEFRTPSEHRLSNNVLPMELQFYHRSSNGLRQAIISLFVIKGRGSAWFDKLWEMASNLPNFKSSESFKFNPDQLIPPKQTFYHYEGSLTHPPCLEGVQWMVFNTPLQLSSEQIANFQNLFGMNNRPLQPIGNRVIKNY